MKSLVNFSISTYNPVHTYPAHAIFIMSRGNQFGRVLDEPTVNNYVVVSDNPVHAVVHRAICQALYIGLAYLPCMRGSVIEYVSIHDARALILAACLRWENNLDRVLNISQKIESLDQLEKHYQNLVIKTRELKRAYSRELSKP